MKDLKKSISDIVGKWKEIAESRIPPEDISSAIELVSNKLENIKPVISLYGAYNSGKSTLLNALVGKELAPVGDSPETYEIAEHKWGNWTIYDTPGIDAPIEHEETTDKHLKESECILFVVSTDGDMEVRDIYVRLAELAQRKKPILVVFNDKSSILSDTDKKQDKLTGIYERYDSNLQKIWSEKELGDVPLPEKWIVNAKSALKARLAEKNGEEKPLLLQQSRIVEVEDRLEEFLRGRGEGDVINGLVDYMQQHFNRLEDMLVKSIDNPDLSEMEKKTQSWLNEHRRITVELAKMIHRKTESLLSDLRNNKANPQEALVDYAYDIQQWLKRELPDTAKNSIDGISVPSSSSESHPYDDGASSISSSVLDDIWDILPRETIKDRIIEAVCKKEKEEAVKAIAKTEPKICAKNAVKTSGKQVLKIPAKVVGPIIDVVFAIVDIVRAHKKQQEHEAQERARVQAMEDWLRRTTSDARDAVLTQSKNIMDKYFSVVEQSLNEQKNQLESQKSQEQRLLETVRELRSSLNALIRVSG